jgi:hypothetical protein
MFGGVSDDEVVDTMGQLHGVSAASHRLFLAGVLEVDQRELWRLDGARSMAMWLDLRFGMSHATAVTTVRVARAFVFTPEIAAQYEADRLSWDQAVACVDLVAFGGLSDAEVALDAVGRSAAELERLAREARRVSRTESEERQRQRYLRMRWGRDGMLRGSFALADVEGKAFETAIRRGADDQPANAEQVPVLRPIEERQADALSDLASARLAADPDPDLATVVVHVDAVDLEAAEAALAVIEHGAVVSMSTVHRLCCDGRVQYLVNDDSGETIRVAKTKHAIPPWLRRKIRHRDNGCRWPGCGRSALLHIHHIKFWTRDRGLTEERNLCGLCPFHHRLVHEGGWTITGDPFGRLTFTSPEGRVLEGGPPGLRDEVRDALGLRWAHDPPVPAA